MEEWPKEAIGADLAALSRAVRQVGEGPARGEAALGFFVGRYGRDRGARVFRAAVRLLAYIERNEAELRRIGVLVVDGGWRVDERFLAELVADL
jgi:hypothetical protein